MSEKYQILRNVTADGKPFEAGQIVSREDVPASCFDSMLRVGHMTPHTDTLASPEVKPAAADPVAEPGGDQPEKKKRGRPRKVKPEGESTEAEKPDEPGDAKPESGEPEPEQPNEPEPDDQAAIPAGI